MQFSKIEMYNILADSVGLGQETMDVIIQVFGDTADTYKKVLTKTTDFKTFNEAFEYYQVPGCV